MEGKLLPWCKRAKIAMIENNITTTELAILLDYNRSYLSAILNGHAKCAPARKRISDFLNISDAEE